MQEGNSYSFFMWTQRDTADTTNYTSEM